MNEFYQMVLEKIPDDDTEGVTSFRTYARLCASLRLCEIAEEKGKSICKWCKKLKSEHSLDGLICSPGVGNMSFVSEQAEVIVQIKKILDEKEKAAGLS